MRDENYPAIKIVAASENENFSSGREKTSKNATYVVIF